MRRTLGAALALALLAACGGSDDASQVPSTVDPASVTTTTTSTVAPEALPPAAALDLEAVYGPALAELGLRLTDRGGLIDRSGGGYEPSASGTHLALYVEPIGERTAEAYVDGIRSVAVVFGDVFDRWSGLESYDVCQEPVEDAPSDNGQSYDPAEPLPVTQIELTRAQAGEIDWATVTVAELIQASRADPPGLALRVASSLVSDPAYRAVAGDGWNQG